MDTVCDMSGFFLGSCRCFTAWKANMCQPTGWMLSVPLEPGKMDALIYQCN